MNRTIKAIMRHMEPLSARSGSTNAPGQPTTGATLQLKAKRKLRVVFAPLPLGGVTAPNH